MQPKAIRNHAVLRGADGLLRLEMVDAGREFVLDPLAELIWDLCDGSRNIEALAQAAGRALDRVVHQEEVFAALDFLADAGLIEERVAPPVAEGNVSRRSLLTRIAPVVGATAWMMSGIAARAGGLIQYNESANKESNNKESNTKAGNREASNKESNTKAGNREVGDKEVDRKSRDRESDDKQDWNRQQDAEKRRKSDSKRTTDEILESTRRSELLQQKMRASWPRVYELLGHKLSEFRELSESWVDPFIIFAHDVSRLTATSDWSWACDWRCVFKDRLSTFGRNVRQSPEALARFTKAGFDLPSDSPNWPPFLAGDSQRKTYLILQQIADPAIGDNWRLAINTDNLLFQFYDPEAAYQFLSSRRPTGTQTKK